MLIPTDLVGDKNCPPNKGGLRGLNLTFQTLPAQGGQALEGGEKNMIFSTRSTYGLRAMINLAKNKKSGSVSLATVAREEDISLKYLERLFGNLKKAGVIKAEKGAAGGYQLVRDAKQVNIYDIIKALEGGLNAFHCTGKKEKIYCSRLCDCGATLVLTKVERAIGATLKDIKLSQLL